MLRLSYASPGWYPFLCDTLKKELEVLSQKRLQSNIWMSRLHSSPAVATRIAHPPPPLIITLNHQALAFYKRALRLSADNFFLQQLASRPVQPRTQIKENTLLAILLLNIKQTGAWPSG